MPMTPKEMINFLEKNGFVQIPNNHGSHQRFKNFSNGRWTVVPVHNKELSKAMEHKILKQAGLKK